MSIFRFALATFALGLTLLPSSTCACGVENTLLEPTGLASVGVGDWSEAHWGYAESDGECAEHRREHDRQLALKRAAAAACTDGRIVGHVEGPVRRADLGAHCVTEVGITWACAE